MLQRTKKLVEALSQFLNEALPIVIEYHNDLEAIYKNETATKEPVRDLPDVDIKEMMRLLGKPSQLEANGVNEKLFQLSFLMQEAWRMLRNMDAYRPSTVTKQGNVKPKPVTQLANLIGGMTPEELQELVRSLKKG